MKELIENFIKNYTQVVKNNYNITDTSNMENYYSKELLQALTSVKIESAEEWWNKNKSEAMDWCGSCEVIIKEDFIQAMHDFANNSEAMKKPKVDEGFIEWYVTNGFYRNSDGFHRCPNRLKLKYIIEELYTEYLTNKEK